jgi:hypothetical protein
MGATLSILSEFYYNITFILFYYYYDKLSNNPFNIISYIIINIKKWILAHVWFVNLVAAACCRAVNNIVTFCRAWQGERTLAAQLW